MYVSKRLVLFMEKYLFFIKRTNPAKNSGQNVFFIITAYSLPFKACHIHTSSYHCYAEHMVNLVIIVVLNPRCTVNTVM
jgi:hypothetical protein